MIQTVLPLALLPVAAIPCPCDAAALPGLADPGLVACGLPSGPVHVFRVSIGPCSWCYVTGRARNGSDCRRCAGFASAGFVLRPGACLGGISGATMTC